MDFVNLSIELDENAIINKFKGDLCIHNNDNYSTPSSLEPNVPGYKKRTLRR